MKPENLLEAPKYKPPVVDEHLRNGNLRGRHPIVACVWVRPKYQLQHVLTLKSMVDRNCGFGYEFVCLTDRVDAVDDLYAAGIRPMMTRDDLPGWWQKVKLFDRSNWAGNERVLFLDLDVVIVDEIDSFFKGGHHTNAIANFGINYRHSKYNSSVVAWNTDGPAARVWDAFKETGPDRVIKSLHGDQCWFWRVMVDNVLVWPIPWVQSYKYEVRQRRPRALGDPKIVVFHGDPKPWDVQDGIVKEHYR